jgi:hypothetical protein
MSRARQLSGFVNRNDPGLSSARQSYSHNMLIGTSQPLNSEL